MPCLIIDTSTELCLIALVKEDRILAQEIFSHGNLLSKNLLPAIQTLIQNNELTPTELDSIAIGIGPGSYTGTRLGVSVGKSLAFGLDIPLKIFSSPLAFLPAQEGAFAFILPTRSGSFFVLKGTSASESVSQESTALVAELKPQTQDVDFLISPTQKALPSEMHKMPFFHPEPNILTLCRFLSKKEPISPENVELLYLHTPF